MRFLADKRYKVLGLALVASIYAISFFLPVCTVFSSPIRGAGAFCIVTVLFETQNGTPRLDEWVLFVLGWMPNPLLWAGAIWFGMGRWRPAAILATLAVVLANVWTIDWNNYRANLDGLLVGYYFWITSMAVLAGLSLLKVFCCTGDGMAVVPSHQSTSV